MTAAVAVSPDWLALREPADARARSSELVGLVRPYLAASRGLVVHDLGAGTGSMGRWMAPLLPGRQRWVVHDHDADLLDRAAADIPVAAADNARVTVEVRHDDVSRLGPAGLEGADLVTASALLDILSVGELERLVATCTAAACPVLMTLTVVGRVDLTPADPLDDAVRAAFNAHQRRSEAGRRLLGPDAVDAASHGFRGRGHDVVLRPSPWHLEADEAPLTEAWLTGWVGAATEQRPALAADAGPYLRARVDQARAGVLTATVHHVDLLALPG